MKTPKKYLVTIELITYETEVTAQNKSEAKMKARNRLDKKKPRRYIDTDKGKQKIYVQEL